MRVDRMVVFGTREYEWLLHPFSAMLYKYWRRPLEVLYFGDCQVGDLPSNVKFIQVPMVSGRNHWDWLSEFGAGVASALQTLDDPIVMVSCMDMWPSGYARLRDVDALAEYLTYRPEVLRVLLGYDNNLLDKGHLVEYWGPLEIRTASVRDPRVGMAAGFLLWPSLWNRELLLSLIIGRTTIWDFEEVHTRNMPPDVYGVWTQGMVLYRYIHVLFRENPRRIRVNGMSAEDKACVMRTLPSYVEVVGI